jgi:hypothetical protein
VQYIEKIGGLLTMSLLQQETFRGSKNDDNNLIASEEWIVDSECSSDDGLSIDDSYGKNAMQLNRSTHSSNDRFSVTQQQLSQKETNSVRRLKTSMISILTLSAIAAGMLTYWYLHCTEYKKFQSMFEDDATKLGQSLYGNVINVLSSLDLISTLMVANARAANEEFPFTKIPSFGNIATKTLSTSIATNLWTVPLIDGLQERIRWEEYAWNHRSFINETLQTMTTDPNYYGDIPWNISMKQSLHGDYHDIPYNESYGFSMFLDLYIVNSMFVSILILFG